ncbi:hypothetical protein QE152_g14080 [Popillia japonica]|uniref:Uncharacterized protein n=1 Tax=Popillia japonica TaxID=7064 RepID=A0AAW1LAC4_POPJA
MARSRTELEGVSRLLEKKTMGYGLKINEGQTKCMRMGDGITNAMGYGLKINEGQTKCMRMGDGITNVIRIFNCNSKSYSFEEVQQFDYLGVTNQSKSDSKTRVNE